jgi:hypothetical protein
MARDRLISRFSWRRLCLAAAVAVGGSLGGGCATPWKQSFEPATDEVFAPTERVVIRQVSWERLNEALGSIESARAGSDIHPSEWSAERRAAEHAGLVQALQLSEEPERVVILGRSVFRSTSNVGVLDGSLSAFAESIGADYAVWSTTFIGRTQTVEQEPVSRYGYTYRRFRDREGRVDYDYIPYHETMYVPILVERDEHAWVVYYARILD